jgi:hypothetical protein
VISNHRFSFISLQGNSLISNHSFLGICDKGNSMIRTTHFQAFLIRKHRFILGYSVVRKKCDHHSLDLRYFLQENIHSFLGILLKGRSVIVIH